MVSTGWFFKAQYVSIGRICQKWNIILHNYILLVYNHLTIRIGIVILEWPFYIYRGSREESVMLSRPVFYSSPEWINQTHGWFAFFPSPSFAGIIISAPPLEGERWAVFSCLQSAISSLNATRPYYRLIGCLIIPRGITLIWNINSILAHWLLPWLSLAPFSFYKMIFLSSTVIQHSK